jgi:hypothetical protein
MCRNVQKETLRCGVRGWVGSPDPVYTLGTFAQHHCTTE